MKTIYKTIKINQQKNEDMIRAVQDEMLNLRDMCLSVRDAI